MSSVGILIVYDNVEQKNVLKQCSHIPTLNSDNDFHSWTNRLSYAIDENGPEMSIQTIILGHADTNLVPTIKS